MTNSFCKLNDSWKSLGCEIEEFLNFGDEVSKNQNQKHLDSLVKTGELIITQLEYIWDDSLNQPDTTNIK